MIIPADSVKKDDILEADICIIGAGAAGIALSLEFFGSRQKICVLESNSPVLNDLEAPALSISRDSRSRAFGGTTNTWLGIWKPFAEEDLADWPIQFSDIADYYDRAARRFSAPALSEFQIDRKFFDSQKIQSTLFARIKKGHLKFADRFRVEFEKAPNVSVYLDATATALSVSGSRIDSVSVRTLSGNSFGVRAKLFVLAAGGIENPRLLLRSRIGNENVGRFYMDHPKGVAGVINKPSRKLKKFCFRGGDKWVGLCLTPETRREKKLLNSHVLLEAVRTPFFRKMISVRIRNFMEQTPDRENRVVLSGSKDALGLPLPRVVWKINETDRRTMAEFHEIFKAELAKFDLGELDSPLLQSGSEFPITKDASHHMGTTRMGADPADAAVDSNCKVYRAENLYVAGSSVFRTAGYANPTATILALAIRLADHLKETIGN